MKRSYSLNHVLTQPNAARFLTIVKIVIVVKYFWFHQSAWKKLTVKEPRNCNYCRSKHVKSCTVHISVEWCFWVLHCFQSYLWDRQTGPGEGKDNAVPVGGKGTLQAAHLCPERTSRTPHTLWEEKHMYRATSVRATLWLVCFNILLYLELSKEMVLTCPHERKRDCSCL